MVSPDDRRPARDKLLVAARQLMLERGYNATTVDDVCALAGVSKGSFYHCFESKEALGLAALETFYNEGNAKVMSGPFTRETDPSRRLLTFLKDTEKRSEEFWGQGCLLGSFAMDLAETHPLIRRRVADLLERLTLELSRLFEPLAAPKGESPTAKELAASYLASLEGSIVLAKAFDDSTWIRKGLETFRHQVEPNLK